MRTHRHLGYSFNIRLHIFNGASRASDSGHVLFNRVSFDFVCGVTQLLGNLVKALVDNADELIKQLTSPHDHLLQFG